MAHCPYGGSHAKEAHDTLLDVSTDGQVLVISPARDKRRTARLKAIVAEADTRYGGVFRRLAE